MSIRDVGFCLDVRRLFVRRVSANVCNLIIENVAQPIAVALVVVFAFLNRDDPFHFSTNFIYFTTLYAFLGWYVWFLPIAEYRIAQWGMELLDSRIGT